MGMLRFVLKYRYLTAVASVLIILSSVPLVKIGHQGYLPQGSDEAEFRVSLEAPQGTSFAAMDSVVQAVEKDLLAMPEVRTILANAGGGFIGGVNQGEFYVRIALKAHPDLYGESGTRGLGSGLMGQF